ncbi:MAG: tetratricopeptide repeat protein [Pirellulales bacterium]
MSLDTMRLLMLAAVLLLPLSAGCTSMNLDPLNVSPSDWQLTSWMGEPAAPGTPEWWKKHKGDSEFVPGKGYRVAEVEGYFDQEGRPIHTRVAKLVDQKKSSNLLGGETIANTFDDLKAKVGMGPDAALAEKSLAAGKEHYGNEQYSQAADEFKQAIARGGDKQVEQEAIFMLAESHFFDTRYPAAIETYERLVKEFPNSPHMDQVIRRQFDIARYWEQHHAWRPHWATTPNVFDKTRPMFDVLGQSLKTYERIRLNDPTGPLADDAIMATANSHFLRGRYADADYHYGLVRSEYPRSEHQFNAHLLGLRSKLRLYQGPDYDGTSLEEAKRLVKQLKVQFAGELEQEERQRLAEVEAQLNKQLVMREWRMAEYYEGTKHYDSARFWYARVIRKYPESELASRARDRMVALVDSPGHPAKKLAWLIEKLPKNAESKAIAQVPLLPTGDSQIRLASGEEQIETEGQEKTKTTTR